MQMATSPGIATSNSRRALSAHSIGLHHSENQIPTSQLKQTNSIHTAFVHISLAKKFEVGNQGPAIMSIARLGRTELPVSEGGKTIRKQGTRQLKKGFTFSSEKKLQMVSRDGSPPVFLEGAVSRAFSQPITKRIRSLVAIGQSIIGTAIWWAVRAPYLGPAFIRARRNLVGRIDIPLNGCSSIDKEGNENEVENREYDQFASALDVYARPGVADEMMELLSGESVSDTHIGGSIRTVVLYVHGGAWGSGNAKQYGPLANLLLYRSSSAGICVCVLSYTLYPHADIQGQADQVGHALKFLRSRLRSCCKVVVLAHSSGAHVTSLALLNNRIDGSYTSHHSNGLADVVILSAPPMDLAHHFLFESRRGVAFVSPMLPAAHAENDASRFDEVSPTVILERMQGTMYDIGIETSRQVLIPSFLEGDIAGSNIGLPESDQSKSFLTTGSTGSHSMQKSPFPHTVILASSCDTTVPFYSALRFAAALRNKGVNARFLVYDGVQHEEFVTDWFEKVTDDKDRHDDHGIETNERIRIVDKNEILSQTLDVSSKDSQTRKNVVNHVLNSIENNRNGINLHRSLPQRLTAASAHVRDVIRIVDFVAASVATELKVEQV